jgi:hypothetical protein
VVNSCQGAFPRSDAIGTPLSKPLRASGMLTIPNNLSHRNLRYTQAAHLAGSIPILVDQLVTPCLRSSRLERWRDLIYAYFDGAELVLRR